ncbi:MULTISPECIES: MlaD family protein [unclassified Pseudomonas]|uniref:PqiB family protein n=1 Tax=unclassified Pseudomonas TaxID=196821 RepID=UPI002AC9886A|nr:MULTISPECIES: MlaD family protein [unclassified Pseudomonas]MEB0043172.1 MlaD family protein [Pseudomonas sp. MH10]MEB0079675.1 MlaD family protein [Pseudomonas sp. MH10out]MEB0093384.1 MlaD family protein [Pseudomonas sp. CCI4.2]MEB0104001.1 MlaD family protein [Pseudomonas sp. CCI3.2]MEB0123380.1 MlaD family protein [Pseudomonas sp. CCI1.2]
MSDHPRSTLNPASGPPSPGAPNIKHRSFNVSLVWIVPIVAALVGLSMVAHNILSAGPEINVSFQTAEGIEVNKTQVKYKNVVIGKVTAIALSEDRNRVDATIDLDASAKSFATEGSRFWVVRPRIGANGISGVGTLLSGAFIGADAGESEQTKKDFVGLETPPPVTYGEKGKRYTLHTDTLGSLDIGSDVYYRRIAVGQVVAYQLSEDGKGVDVQIFVHSPNDQFVTKDTRFWNASGVNVSLDANGLKVDTESVSSILAGGIAFVEPKYSPNPVVAEEDATFSLFVDQQTAMAPADGDPHFIRMRFDQPLRGLSVNAPVEFHGVNIGRVVSVDLDYDATKKDFPTMIGAVIYPNRLGKAHETLLKQAGADKADDLRTQELMAEFVKQGLRAQARSGNLLTGQLYIALDFVPNAKPVAFNSTAQPLDIPTIPGSLDKLQEQLQQIVDKISKLPIDQIASNLNGSLTELQKTLKQVNGDVLPQMRDTLAQTKKTLASANDSFSEDSPQRQELGQAMQEVKRTARSVRVLTDFLGRHPEALIRGRVKTAQPDGYTSSPSSSREIDPE